MKKHNLKFLALIFIIPLLFSFTTYLNSAENNSVDDSYIEKPLEDENNSNNNDNENNSTPSDNNENNDTENEDNEDNDNNEDESSSEQPEIEEPSNENFNVAFEIINFEELNMEYLKLETPKELEKFINGLTIDSNEGLVYYIKDNNLSNKYAFHFFDKEGKEISTTTKNNKEYLIFDLYIQSPFGIYETVFSISDKEYVLNVSAENIINEEQYLYKFSFEIELHKDATLTFDMTKIL